MGHVSVKQDPFLSQFGINELNQSNQFMNSANNILSKGPVTTLPANMESNVQMGNYPKFLSFGSSKNPNPLFNSTDPQKLANWYDQQFYNNMELPQIGEAAEQQFLGGNLGTSGSSSFGADFLSNLDASAAADAALQGQQYYTNDVNNFLNERQNYYGTQIAPDLQAQEFNQQQDLAGLGLLNNFNLDAAGAYGNLANTSLSGANAAFNQNNVQTQENMQAQAANANNLAGLTTGLGGLAGGFLNLGLGGGSTIGGSLFNGAKNLGSGIWQGMTGGGSPSGGFNTMNQPFQASDFMLTGGF